MNTRKDNVDLICSIGELAGLFENSSSLENFLQNVVSIVAYHMRAAVCSVYLYDEEKQELVLTATQGLSELSVGQVRLKLGEGLTGVALKELRPIREGSGSRNPNYKFIPGIYEEKFEAFLAVPILRGLSRVGVLVLQDPVTDYFDENDTKALLAIAAQLASTIENAKLLMALHRIRTDLEAEKAPAVPAEELRFIKGKAGARGYAVGHPTVFSIGGEDFLQESEFTRDITGGLEDFQYALSRTEQQLEELQTKMEKRLADVASMIFSAHLLIVKDPKFSGAMIELIKLGSTARDAIVAVIKQYIELFAGSKNPRLREKVQDVKDLGHRLLRNLYRDEEDNADYAGHVIIAGELLPSDVLKLSAQNAEGIILVGGAETAHVTLLAKSLELPLVLTNEERVFQINPSRRILIDGDHGNIYVDPERAVIDQFRQMEEDQKEAEAVAANMAETNETADGKRVELLANINMLSELKVARQLRAEGIGLYRSEFPFIVRTSFPSEEEQYRVYRTLVEKMEGMEITFRTLDVGGDKALSYFPGKQENNPFLGLRAIRFSLRYRDVFEHQLRAVLRAGHDANLRIMFPLVSSIDDYLEARSVVEDCIAKLTEEGIPHITHPRIGVMIELPAVVEIADELAREVDFLSIGGNDLVQYILAVDRTNEQMSELYQSHHPAVLRALKKVADAARRHKKSLSFCGEMAADPRMLPFLLGIGIHRLSIEPRKIPGIHNAVRSYSLKDCRKLAKQLLAMSRLRDIEQALNDFHAIVRA
ncbi:MAG: phosphoenolpyruvate--protein phosphotransferase [Verrucomicrobia bacterium]|nr:phosphoenolpyruvate--protein phosphotransferase [Verrucomicrobiota bacterium]